MTLPLVTALPVVAVATALVAGGLAVALREPAYGVVEVQALGGLTLGGVGGGAAPAFDVRDLAPATYGATETFVVTRTARPLPGTLTLQGTDLVDDEGVCAEPETDCGGAGELSGQALVLVRHASHGPAGCGLLQPVAAGEVGLRQLAERPLAVRSFAGSASDEQVCVSVTVRLPDRPDNNEAQGDRMAFGLQFVAGGTA